MGEKKRTRVQRTVTPQFRRDAVKLVNEGESITEIHAANRKVYSSPRIYNALRDRDIRCSKHRVAKIMRFESLRGCSQQSFRSTATVRAEIPASPNRLGRPFQSQQRGRIRVGDITQVRTGQG
jgi:putative transposase